MTAHATFRRRTLALALAPVLAIALPGPASAMEVFQTEDGFTLNVDTTLSYGISIRDGKRDSALVGIANGGTMRSVNEDDGDLLYGRGKPFANLVKATMDVELKYGSFGFFGRGTAYYDFENAHKEGLGPIARQRVGEDVVGLDAFFYGSLEPLGHTLRVRAGRQVINWGESTFIPNGINVVSPLDLSRLRVPGSELKEAFIPTTGIWASQEITKAASVEGFYLTNFDKIKLDPRATYFSNNDFASDDGYRVILSFGRRKDQHFPPSNPVPFVVPTIGPAAAALYGPFDPAASVWAPRSNDHDPSDNGQYGLALRYFAEELNNTEFGLYYVNYHSRVPLFSGIKGTPTSVLTGGPLIPVICSQPALRALCHTGTANYYAEYPEDIHLWGLSFSTAAPWGIALQGEYSYRPNLPVQYATPELLLAALGLPNLITGYTQIPGQPTGVTEAALVPDGTTITGYKRLKASQLQATATKVFPAVLESQALTLVGEVGMTYFHDLPKDLKFNAPGVLLPATQLGALASGAYSTQPGGYLTSFSWGYRLAARMEYANVLAGGNVIPRVAWAQDVNGVGNTFNQGAKAWSVGASWEYQRQWVVDLQYTGYFGGRTWCGTDVIPPGGSIPPGQSASWCSGAYPLRDRDFYSLSVSYAF